MTAAQEPLLVDAPGLAVLLGVSPRTIRRLDDAGKLPEALRLGGSKRWLRSEIETWLTAGAPPRREWNARRNAGRNLRSALADPRRAEA